MAEDAAAIGPITTEGELRAWLDSVEDPRIHSAFGARNALRCLPAALSEIDVETGKYRGVDLTVAVLRASLISGVVGTWPTPEMSEDLREAAFSAARSAGLSAANSTANSANSAANSANSAAFSAANSAAFSAARSAGLSAANSTANSANSAANSARSAANSASLSAANSAAFSAAYLDGEHLQNADPLGLFATPLWPEENPVPEWERTWADFQSRPDPKAHWVFWVKWYRSMLNGQPLDWDLQRRIALEITDEEWTEGPGTVARRIAEIEDDFNAQSKADPAPPIEPEDPFRNEETARGLPVITAQEAETVKSQTLRRADVQIDAYSGTYHLTTIAITSERAVRLAVDRVIDAFDDAKRICGHNGFNDQRIEVVILNRAHAKYLEDAERLAFDYTDVQLSLNKAMKDELPADSALQILYTALRVAVTEITEADPGIAAALDRNYGTAPEDTPDDDTGPGPTEEETLLLTDAMRVFPEITDEPLGNRLEEGLAEVLTGEIVNETPFDQTPIGGPRLRGPRKSAVSELAAITADMYVKLRAAPEETKKKLAEHYDSETSKAVGVTARYGGALALIGAVAKYLANLLGF